MVDIEKFTDKQVVALGKLYGRAERDILKATTRALLRGNSTHHLNAFLDQVQTIQTDLLAGARTWTDVTIPRAYDLGADGTGLEKAVNLSFDTIDQRAMKILADNTYSRFEEIDQFVGRKVDDIYRALSLENTSGAIAGYQTWKQVAKDIKDDLAEHGVTGFVDRAGKEWDMETYSEMVARTNIAETQRTAAKNRIRSRDHYLAMISEGTSQVSCEACETWAGQVVSLTGSEEGGYPPIEEAEADGVFHPNCVHRLVAAIEEEEALAEEEGGEQEEE